MQVLSSFRVFGHDGLEKSIGVRVSHQVERLGQDVAELGIDAYPEFVLMPEPGDET